MPVLLLPEAPSGEPPGLPRGAERALGAFRRGFLRVSGGLSARSVQARWPDDASMVAGRCKHGVRTELARCPYRAGGRRLSASRFAFPAEGLCRPNASYADFLQAGGGRQLHFRHLGRVGQGGGSPAAFCLAGMWLMCGCKKGRPAFYLETAFALESSYNQFIPLF